jgi:hypothetical protein
MGDVRFGREWIQSCSPSNLASGPDTITSKRVLAKRHSGGAKASASDDGAITPSGAMIRNDE